MDNAFKELVKDLDLTEDQKAVAVKRMQKLFDGRVDFALYMADWAKRKGMVFLPVDEPRSVPMIMMSMGGSAGLEYFKKVCEKLDVKTLLLFPGRKGFTTFLGFTRGGFLYSFDVLREER